MRSGMLTTLSSGPGTEQALCKPLPCDLGLVWSLYETGSIGHHFHLTGKETKTQVRSVQHEVTCPVRILRKGKGWDSNPVVNPTAPLGPFQLAWGAGVMFLNEKERYILWGLSLCVKLAEPQ